jgi:hypothetical protein
MKNRDDITRKPNISLFLICQLFTLFPFAAC